MLGLFRLESCHLSTWFSRLSPLSWTIASPPPLPDPAGGIFACAVRYWPEYRLLCLSPPLFNHFIPKNSLWLFFPCLCVLFALSTTKNRDRVFLLGRWSTWCCKRTPLFSWLLCLRPPRFSRASREPRYSPSDEATCTLAASFPAPWRVKTRKTKKVCHLTCICILCLG